MKSVPFLAGFCAVLGAAALHGRADNAPAPAAPPVAANLKSTTPLQALPPGLAPTAPPSSLPLYSASPLDSTDFSTGDPETEIEHSIAVRDQRQSEPDFQAFDQQQQQRAYDNDWMLRDYTAGLKKQGLANTPDTDPSLLPQARDPNAIYKDPLLPENQVATPAEKKRQLEREQQADPMSLLAPSQSLSPGPLQPLLPPLTDSTKPMRNPWAKSDDAAALANTTAPDATDMFPSMSRAHDMGTPDNSDNSLLDSPGMTAQEQGLTRGGDLSLQDALPDENENRITPHVNRSTDFLVPTAPANDVTDFFKKQADALQAPTAPTVQQPLGVSTTLKQPLPPVGAPMPLAKPSGSSLRYHVPDPFDILNRPAPSR
jgi:hypothetical protein